MSQISIVIPSKTIRNLQLCVRSIVHYEGGSRHTVRIVVVLDGIAATDHELPAPKGSVEVSYVQGIAPFVFARNVNIGAQVYPDADVVVMNDDALLRTQGGISGMCEAMRTPGRMHYGVVSASIAGVACNPKVIVPSNPAIRQSHEAYSDIMDAGRMVPFICAAIRREVWERVGRLDEQFVDYGFEDDDFCRSCRTREMKIGVYTGCVVEHGSLPSTFRNQGHCPLEPNRLRYIAKWGNHEGA